MKIFKKIKPTATGYSVAVVSLMLFVALLYPLNLFDVPYSTSIYSSDGQLLGARIADDGQWRFHPTDTIPEMFGKCVCTFEDEYFNYHFGVNPVSLIRAAYSNVVNGRVTSGGSTITMQVARINKKRSRTLLSKIIEAFTAVKIEIRYSKSEILSMYASHAPYGGNVVGLEAASWRYFGCKSSQLSWGQCATLAVLPNAPSLIHPGRNRDALLQKRNRLLKKLLKRGFISDTEYRLSVDEPLPERVQPLPDIAPHAVERLVAQQQGDNITTTINYDCQTMCNRLVDNYYKNYSANEIHNIALLVVDTETGYVLAYVGNTNGNDNNGHNVDVVSARRSTGSLLKPMLYAASLQDGLILPQQLLSDIPTYYSDYKPENYNKTYDGAVPAMQALSRSLNIPAVRLLHEYGTDKMVAILRRMGLTEIDKQPSHYGLSLMLGGAESTLWSLTGAYASMGRILGNYGRYGSQYSNADIHAPSLFAKANEEPQLSFKPTVFSASSLWLVLDALSKADRPDDEAGWQRYADGRPLAWKTGTSFGFRDAWSIGITPKYTVGVWVGNASGEGRPGIVGGQVAAPIMFDVFRRLPKSKWFEKPLDDMKRVAICHESGCLASEYCPDVDTISVCAEHVFPLRVCNYHRIVHLDASRCWRVNSNCYPIGKMVNSSWFVLPPVEEFYYTMRHPEYLSLPMSMSGCDADDDQPIGLVHPQPNARVFLPKGANGVLQQVVFTATHRQSGAQLFWYLDGEYVATTTGIHQIALQPEVGIHTLTILDSQGNRLQSRFTCVGRSDV